MTSSRKSCIGRSLALGVLSVFCVLAMATACTSVQPWQKGTLAKPDMTIEGSDALGAKALDHVYVSREGASGGAGVGGGGCGCN